MAQVVLQSFLVEDKTYLPYTHDLVTVDRATQGPGYQLWWYWQVHNVLQRTIGVVALFSEIGKYATGKIDARKNISLITGHVNTRYCHLFFLGRIKILLSAVPPIDGSGTVVIRPKWP